MTQPTQWEMIFQNDPHLFAEPSPRVVSFAEQLLDHDLSSVLDIGCGPGRHVIHMTQKGLRVTGLDNAPTALSLTRQWLDKEGLHAGLVLNDMRQSLPFESASFDAVLSTQVIHHAMLATVIGTAREIERVVRPNGMILISVPMQRDNREDTADDELLEPNTYAPASGEEKGLPHHLFTPEEFREIFPRFQVIDLRVIDERVIALQAIKK